MTTRAWWLAVSAWIAMAAPVAAQRRGGEAPFPHERHERLFPLCESCHAGIATGDAASSMPSEASCRECHNGTDARTVAWQRPAPVAGLLRYSHPAHARQVDSTGRACTTCHGGTVTRRMDIHPAAPEGCLGCHTHRASAHLGNDNRCATCHVALTVATGLTRDQVAGLPKPASHERTDFAAAHSPVTPVAAASCAVCHARESCARCHVNASTQPIIAALGRDDRVASLVAGRPAVYPIPADHADPDFAVLHGPAARTNAARCSACHARPSCTSCHVGAGASDVIGRLPMAERGGAPGVQLKLQPARFRPIALAMPAQPARSDTTPTAPRIVRVHEAGFARTHGPRAAASPVSCAGCHAQRFCSDCHAGDNQRRFHRANFVQRHAADSYGRETECASCHNAELFCRSCHRESGLASKGRLDVAFHNAQPQWLLQHGRAARQGLQSCATCHAQRDCLACHSTTGWGVNPHGPGFRAERLATRNVTQCLLCHLKVPGAR